MIAFIGNYIDHRIKKERGLPSWNVAASNRISRLGYAIKTTGKKVCIVSPASSMRLAWAPCRILHKYRVTHQKGLPVISCTAFGLRYVSIFLDGLFVVGCLVKLNRRHPITGMLVYNYSTACLLSAFVAKVFFRVPVVMDLEDVASLSAEDLLKRLSVFSILQQSLFMVTRKLTLRLVTAVVTPSKRFVAYLPPQIEYKVVTGCMPIADKKDRIITEREDKIRILFAGKIEKEHGVLLLLEACSILELRGEDRYQFDICGQGNREEEVLERAGSFKHVKVVYHGYISDNEYKGLLEKADICLALQDPLGRNARFKTPSKGYEAMASGKMLVVTDIGDFSDLPSTTCLLLKEYSGIAFADLLTNLNEQDVLQIQDKAFDFAWEHWRSELVGKEIVALLEAGKR